MLSIAVALAGCLSISFGDRARHVTHRDSQGASCVQDNWWESFHDEQLTTYIECILEQNPTMQMACARVGSAYANVVQRDAHDVQLPAFVPFLSGESHTVATLVRAYDEMEVWHQTHAECASCTSAPWESICDDKARVLLTSTIVDVYLSLKSHQRCYDILQQLCDTQQELVALMRQQTCADTDVHRANMQCLTVMEALVQMRDLIAIDTCALAGLMGTDILMLERRQQDMQEHITVLHAASILYTKQLLEEGESLQHVQQTCLLRRE